MATAEEGGAQKLSLRCPNCKTRITAYADEAGKTGTCPGCAATVRIPPDIARKTEAEPAAEEVAPPPEVELHEEKEDETVHTPVMALIEMALEPLRSLKGKSKDYRRYQSLLVSLGATAILAAAVLVLVEAVVSGLRESSAITFLGGLGTAVAFVVAHYVAARFAHAGMELLRNNSLRMSAASFLDCLGLVAAVMAVAALVKGIAVCIAASQLALLWPYLVALVLFGHLAMLCLNPTVCLNTQILSERTTAGETGLCILAFLFRCALGLTPVIFGFAGLVGTAWLAVLMVRSWAAEPVSAYFVLTARQIVIGAALTPVVLYLGYVVLMLIVELCTAIWRIAWNTKRI